jgi:DNA-dependent metalloprotease WSS1
MNDPLEPFKVHEIQALKKRSNKDEAATILHQIARQVQPILRKRRWTVRVLKEFFPGNPNLLVWIL